MLASGKNSIRRSMLCKRVHEPIGQGAVDMSLGESCPPPCAALAPVPLSLAEASDGRERLILETERRGESFALSAFAVS